jgi:hypothetical protein
MQLELIEFIDEKLRNINEILREDDAYYVRDAIISNLEDPDLPDLIEKMLDSYGYTQDIKDKIADIIYEIIDHNQE